jgi:hypothetical protein
VKGKINGISHDGMQKKWLQLEGDQTFSAPQRFKKINVLKNLNVEEINGMNLNSLIENSIYTDEEINIETLQVTGLLAVAGKLITPLINGEPFTEKLVLNNTQEYQQLKKLIVNGNAFVQHLNFTTLNGVICKDFLNVFNGNDELPINLKITGKAIFTHPINITFLNYVNLLELYNTVWLANRDVDLTGENVKFMGEIKVEGPLYADVSV